MFRRGNELLGRGSSSCQGPWCGGHERGMNRKNVRGARGPPEIPVQMGLVLFYCHCSNVKLLCVSI